MTYAIGHMLAIDIHNKTPLTTNRPPHRRRMVFVSTALRPAPQQDKPSPRERLRTRRIARSPWRRPSNRIIP